MKSRELKTIWVSDSGIRLIFENNSSFIIKFKNNSIKFGDSLIESEIQNIGIEYRNDLYYDEERIMIEEMNNQITLK